MLVNQKTFHDTMASAGSSQEKIGERNLLLMLDRVGNDWKATSAILKWFLRVSFTGEL